MDVPQLKPLNGIRFVAITLVIYWHYIVCLLPNNKFVFLNKVKNLSFWTWSGVDLFFILSGFLIGYVITQKDRNDFSIPKFYKNRALRIFPAYYTFLILVGLFNLYNTTSNYFTFPLTSYLLFFQNLYMSYHQQFGSTSLGVTLSLALEMQFYLLIPLVFKFIKPGRLIYLFSILILIAAINRYFTSGLTQYVMLPMRIDSLSIGLIISILYTNGKLESTYYRFKNKFPFLILTLFVLVLLSNGDFGLDRVLIFSLLAFMYGTLLVLVLYLRRGVLYGFLNNKLVQYFSKISFMIYLSHQFILEITHKLFLNQPPSINNAKEILFTILALLLTVLWSTITYEFIEKPFIRIKEK